MHQSCCSLVARSDWTTASTPATGTNDPARIWANIFAAKQDLFFQRFAAQARLLFNHCRFEARPLLKHSLDARQNFCYNILGARCGLVFTNTTFLVCRVRWEHAQCLFARMHIPMTLSAEISVGNPLHIRMLIQNKKKRNKQTKMSSCLNKSVASQAFLHVQSVVSTDASRNWDQYKSQMYYINCGFILVPKFCIFSMQCDHWTKHSTDAFFLVSCKKHIQLTVPHETGTNINLKCSI